MPHPGHGDLDSLDAPEGPVDRFDVRTAPSELAVEEIAAADGGYVRRLRSTSYAADE